MAEHTAVVGVVSEPGTWMDIGQQELPCDMVELRVDALAAEARRLPLQTPCPKPLLLTLRHASEGGQCSWTESERVQLAQELLPAAAAIDWEIARLSGAEELIRQAKSKGALLIASAHYFTSTPDLAEMQALEAKAKAAGADIVKIAFTPHDEEEMRIGVDFLHIPRSGIRAAVMGMGALAATSRALYTKHGSALLYGYLGNTPSAPGQLSAAECRRIAQASL